MDLRDVLAAVELPAGSDPACIAAGLAAELAALGVTAPAHVVEGFGVALGRWRAAEATLEAEGTVACRPSGLATAHPMVGVAATYRRAVRAAWADLVATAGGAGPGEPDPLDELLDGGA